MNTKQTTPTTYLTAALLIAAIAAERHLTLKRLERHHRRREAVSAAQGVALGIRIGAEGNITP